MFRVDNAGYFTLSYARCRPNSRHSAALQIFRLADMVPSGFRLGVMAVATVNEYEVETPSVADYCRLCSEAGLTPRSIAAAEAGLPKTVAGIVLKRVGHFVGMGRPIGDGLFYQIVDITVMPDHQGRGLGNG